MLGANVKYLSNSIQNLIDLQFLALVDCKLENLPNLFGALKMFQKIYFQGKKSTLPNNIMSLTKLEELDPSKYTLRYLPNSIFNLINLRWLFSDDCKLESLLHSTSTLVML